METQEIDEEKWQTSKKIKRTDRSKRVNTIRKNLAKSRKAKGQDLEFWMDVLFYRDYVDSEYMRTNISLLFDTAFQQAGGEQNAITLLDSPMDDEGVQGYAVLAIDRITENDERICFREVWSETDFVYPDAQALDQEIKRIEEEISKARSEYKAKLTASSI